MDTPDASLWSWFSANAVPLSAFGTALTAAFTLAIAFFTSRSIHSVQKTTLAQALLDLTQRYQSQEMLDALDALRGWQREHGAEFAKRFAEALDQKEAKASDLNRHRRTVTHYFHNVMMLYRLGVIGERAVKTIVFPFQVDFLLEVVEPLERTRVGYKDIRYMFDLYRQLYELPPYSPPLRRRRWFRPFTKWAL